MKGLLIVSIILIPLLFVGERLLRKKITITSENNKSKRVKVVEGSVIFLLLVGLIIGMGLESESLKMFYWYISFYYASSLFRVFMEWQFNRAANRWFSELYSIFVLTLMFLTVYWSGILP
ncbi:DUF4181 domain-containing protein [Sporosarcina sp. FSL K6-1522]|uniref:DUF4181 domain-containing protein n=1 Tax=Sporosarcina sp. FSL K6-1522 TaxID=2921554 RepID=UPI003159CE59